MRRPSLSTLTTLTMHSGASAADLARSLPGDDALPDADLVMDRVLDLPAAPADVWAWLVQLGKDRGGWYMPRGVERFIPTRRRGLWRIDPRWQGLAVGDEIPDWGPGRPTFRVLSLTAPEAIVYDSHRPSRRSAEGLTLTWALVLTPAAGGSRLHLRLRTRTRGGIRSLLLSGLGGVIDWATIALLGRGLRQRLTRAGDARWPTPADAPPRSA